MDIEFINKHFTSDLTELEDKFLGFEISPKVLVERIFYLLPYNPNKRTKKDEYRIIDKSYYPEIDYEYTSLNYNELDFDFWNNLLYTNEESYLPTNVFSELDNFLQSSKDLPTKQFTVTYIKDKIQQSINELENKQEQNLNKHQKIIIERFVAFYKSCLNSLQSNKYSVYLKIYQEDNSTIAPKHPFEIDTLQEIIYPDNINNILDYEKRLIEDKYFDENYFWKNKYGSQKKLILFCLVLIEKGYTKKSHKHKKIKAKDVFNFFSKRYHIELGDLTKPSKYQQFDTRGEYTFIDNLNK